MTEEQTLSHGMLIKLEDSEIAYWSKYYTGTNALKSASLKVGGAFAGAVPEIDILAMNRVIGLGLRQRIQRDHIEEIMEFDNLPYYLMIP